MLIREPATISEAMEALAAVAECEEWEDLSYYLGAEREGEILHLPSIVLWLEDQDRDSAIMAIRHMFGRALEYLRDLAHRHANPEQAEELHAAVRTLMTTVGEAAHRLDRVTNLVFGQPAGTVQELPEYKELQGFYRAHLKPKKGSKDALNQILQDREYEILHMTRGDGTSFVTREMEESISLACDFGPYMEAFIADDPLVYLQEWIDGIRQSSAQTILRQVRPYLLEFYRHARGAANKELVVRLHYALMALMFAANPRNKLESGPVKASFMYYEDFIYFLRMAVESPEYERLIAYPPKQGQSFLRCLRDLTNALCFHLMTHKTKPPMDVVRSLVGEQPTLWEEYNQIVEVLKRHPSGPLFKVIDLLREESVAPFDPLELGNLPGELFELGFDEPICKVLRMPSPTHQAQINRAEVLSEFEAALASKEMGSYLMINLQERTSARSHALERLHENIHVITLATNTPFALQEGESEHMRNAEQWLTAFEEELKGESYHFPEDVHLKLFESFVPELLKAVHKLYFHEKNSLSRPARLDFIQLVHFFITLELIDIVQPSHFSYTCKDGVDTSMGATAALKMGLAVLQEKSIDREAMWETLFLPALLFRERPIQKEEMDRLQSFVSRLESGDRHHQHEELAPLVRPWVIGVGQSA